MDEKMVKILQACTKAYTITIALRNGGGSGNN